MVLKHNILSFNKVVNISTAFIMKTII